MKTAKIFNVETECKLIINSTDDPAVEGTESGNITRTLTDIISTDNGNVTFYVALPKTTLNASRYLEVTNAYHTYLFANIATGEYANGKMLNTVAGTPTPIKYKENDVDFGYGTFIPETGVIWAPVNCGYDEAHPYGLFYQWGRKYGQGYDGDAPSVIKTECTSAFESHVDQDNTNQDRFYYSSNLANWYGGSEPEKLWDTTGGSITIHAPSKSSWDPCPTGWRIPTIGEFLALLGTVDIYKSNWPFQTYNGLKGHWFDGSKFFALNGNGIFLSVGGDRSGYNGDVDWRNTCGYYWSSSIGWSALYSDYRPYYMWLSSSEGSIGINSNYSDGHTVRCVQE